MREKMAERGVQREIGWHASGRRKAIAAGAPESAAAGLTVSHSPTCAHALSWFPV